MTADYREKADGNDRVVTRRRRREFRTKRWKQWLALDRELSELRRIKRDAPEVPLDKPYQRGWVRYFVLDERMSKRADASDAHLVLNAINSVQYCRKGLFLDHVWHKGRRPLKHKLRETLTTNIHQTGLPGDLLSYFVLPSGIALRGYQHVRELRLAGYNLPLTFIHRDRCISIVEPHFITHRKVAMPAVDARIRKIENFMEHHQVWEKLHSYRWRERYRERDRAIKRCHEHEIQEEILQFETEKGTVETVPFFLFLRRIVMNRLNDRKIGDLAQMLLAEKFVWEIANGWFPWLPRLWRGASK